MRRCGARCGSGEFDARLSLDRDAVLALFKDGLAEARGAVGLTTINLHSAPATAFLRTHDPKTFGDDLSAVEVFRTQAVENRRLVAAQEEAERAAELDKRAAMAGLADRFERDVSGIIDRVSAAAEALQGTARGMSGAATTTSERVRAAA